MTTNNGMLIFSIEDRKYGMRKMPPIQGAAFALKVLNLVSGVAKSPDVANVLQAIQAKFTGSKEMGNNDALTVGAGLLSLISAIDTEKLNAIFREAVKHGVYFENSNLADDVAFEEHFAKYPGDIYPVLVWCTWNNVSDFFTGIGVGLKALMKSLNPPNADKVE